MTIKNKLIISLMAVMLMVSTVWAKDYYVDATTGSDASAGTSSTMAWRTLNKVNSTQFAPGDNIYLKRGEVWNEQLIVPSSGTITLPITFSAYGTGNNPVIKCSDSFTEWTLYVDMPPVKIWKGTIKGVVNSWGAMKDGTRLEHYIGYVMENQLWSAPVNLQDMAVGSFYSPLNSSRFYVRNDAGTPGSIDIGSRQYGILVQAKQNIVLNSIDVTGPSGRPTNGSHDYIGQIHVDGCDGIIIKNCVTSNHNLYGIRIIGASTNCRVENIASYGHGNTGVYFAEAGEGNSIVDSKVYNCGRLSSDIGDCGLIGVWLTPGVRIERCTVYANGHESDTFIDAGISYVQSPNGFVNRCEIYNIAGNALQFAEGSDFGVAAYNVIYDWGIYKLPEMNHGIRIGGGSGSSTAINCQIFNNLLDNRRAGSSGGAALRVLYHSNHGLRVKNNIFLSNEMQYDLFIESKDNFAEWNFSNNIYYRTSGVSVYYAKLNEYDYDHLFGDIKGYFSFDTGLESNSTKGDPLISVDSKSLSDGSRCIDKGIGVGLMMDFNGNRVPYGDAPDIGPFEYQFLMPPKTVKLIN
jgi:hypothetical protein